MRTRVRLVPAEAKHIGRIARLMRDPDRLECEAMGRTPKQALRLSLAVSDKAWTALVDDQPEAMFGVMVDSVLGRTAVPWFLGTDEVYRHGRELIMWGPGMISRFGDYDLRNLVAADNTKAIRLLKRWGFSLSDEVLFCGGVEFRPFSRLRDATIRPA